MTRFEQLIEYVINDEEQKARELFHEIVVEKSRQIYENLMAEEAQEDLDEAAEDLDEAAEDLDEAAEDLDEAAEDLDEAAEDVEESAMGGNAAEGLMDEVETEESSDMNTMEDGGEEEGEEDFEMGTADDEADAGMDADVGGSDEPATKDDIMNLEDKLDELMAEFEQLMGDEAADHSDDMGDGDEFGPEEGGDAIATDDTAEMEPMAEAISLKQVKPKVTTSEEGNGKAGPVAFNSGKTGMQASPVKTGADNPEGKHDTAAYKMTTKDLISDVQNQPGKDMKAQKPATKPHLAQATGVNTKSPLPSGRRG